MTPTPSLARRLTTHQQAVLIQVLRAFPEQEAGVQYSASASDGIAYARDFLTIFMAVGWSVNDPACAGCPATATGLAVVVGEDKGLPPGAEALRDALRIYSIEVEAICDPMAKITARSFVLRIGANS
jgi:hypothetical protein